MHGLWALGDVGGPLVVVVVGPCCSSVGAGNGSGGPSGPRPCARKACHTTLMAAVVAAAMRCWRLGCVRTPRQRQPSVGGGCRGAVVPGARWSFAGGRTRGRAGEDLGFVGGNSCSRASAKAARYSIESTCICMVLHGVGPSGAVGLQSLSEKCWHHAMRYSGLSSQESESGGGSHPKCSRLSGDLLLALGSGDGLWRASRRRTRCTAPPRAGLVSDLLSDHRRKGAGKRAVQRGVVKMGGGSRLATIF